jgi:hypothetical protein
MTQIENCSKEKINKKRKNATHLFVSFRASMKGYQATAKKLYPFEEIKHHFQNINLQFFVVLFAFQDRIHSLN